MKENVYIDGHKIAVESVEVDVVREAEQHMDDFVENEEAIINVVIETEDSD